MGHRLHAVGQDLVRPVLILFKAAIAQTIHQHGDDRSREESSNYDQQQFHGLVLTQPVTAPTPAADGRWISAEMATVRPFLGGKSADLPFHSSPAMLGLSKKEDASWMNSVALHPAPQTVAGSVSSLPLLSLFWSCFTHSLLVVRSAQRLILRQSAPQNKALLRWKKPHQFNPSPRRQTTSPNSTHLGNCLGGRSDASAFVVSSVHALRAACARFVPTPNTPKPEACPC